MDIYGYKCRKCGYINYPFRMVCKKCKKNDIEEFDPVVLPKNGKLLTFTRLHTLPMDFDVPSLLLGIVELENGTRMTGQLDMENPEIGMNVVGRMDVVRKSQYKQSHGMIFSKS